MRRSAAEVSCYVADSASASASAPAIGSGSARAEGSEGGAKFARSLLQKLPEDRREVSSAPGNGALANNSALVALDELQEYHSQACRERVAFRHERSELRARLVNCEHELSSEEQIGEDLAGRLETLEAAIRRERVQYEGFLKAERPSSSADAADSPSGAIFDPSTEPGRQMPLPPQQEAAWQILSAYLERFPQSRERSCRPLLVERLRRAGLEDAVAEFNGSTEQLAGTECSQAAASAETAGVGRPSNDNAVGCNGASTVPSRQGPTWGRKWSFRSHLDGARCVCCDEDAGVLISCGEDSLVKGWDLGPLWRGAPHTDELEPYVTFRGHTAAVLALTYRPQDRTLFSAGMDNVIRAWHLPESNAYNAYSVNSPAQRGSLRMGVLAGHSNTVWSLERHPHLPFLASASADGSIGLWNAEACGNAAPTMESSLVVKAAPGISPAIERAEATQQDIDTPSCVAWLHTDVTKVIGGYMSSRVAIFDARRESQVLDLFTADASSARAVTSVCCHNVQQLAVTGHADHSARLMDLNSGRFVSTLADHTDAVTSVCIDPAKGHYLVTGSHDGYARTFDLRTGRCCQRLRLHQSKYDESIHCAFIFQKLLATAGADGSVVVMLQE